MKKLLLMPVLLAVFLLPFGDPAQITRTRVAEAKEAAGQQRRQPIDLSVLRNGDVIFQATNSPQSLAIKKATGSEYTHCAIILEKDGYLQAFEAVRKVGWTPVDAWVQRGVNGHYVLMRLKAPSLLTAEKLASMRKDTAFFNGLDYDIFFQWGDEQIYCSELVWKLYKRNANIELGPLRAFRDYNLNHAEVRRIIKERYGRDLPPDAPVIAPSDLMACDELEIVAKN